MKKLFAELCLSVLALLFSSAGLAGTVTLTPSTATPVVGETFLVTISGSGFTPNANPSLDQTTIGAVLGITYSAGLTYVGPAGNCPPCTGAPAGSGLPATGPFTSANGGNYTPHFTSGVLTSFDITTAVGASGSFDAVILAFKRNSAGAQTITLIDNQNTLAWYQYNDPFGPIPVSYNQLVPPGAYDDSATTYLSKPVNIDVLANDEGFVSPVAVTIPTGPQNGTAVVIGSPGDPSLVYVTYTPAAGFQGVDTFQYSVEDGTTSGVATVTVTVNAPQASPDSVITQFATPVAIDVLANDSGFSDPVTVTVTSSPLNGTAVVTSSPGNAAAIRINYTPDAGFTGSDSLQYQVTDGVNTASATVSVTVAAFRAVDDQYNVLSYDNAFLNVVTNDIGFQDPVTLTILTYPALGSAHVDNSPGPQLNVLIHYFPDYNGNYTTTMTYQVSDGVHTDTATVTIHAVSYIAQDDVATTGAGNPVTIDVAQNDLGFNYPRIVGLFASPHHGSAMVHNPDFCCDDPTITYTSSPGFFGDDTFQYAIDDDTHIAIATVTVHVINDADNDLVDDNSDNCVGIANANQRDADGDGYGSMCDADFNNDGHVNFADLAAFRSKFTTADPTIDMDGNGIVNFADLARLRTLFGAPPGPSALHP